MQQCVVYCGAVLPATRQMLATSNVCCVDAAVRRVLWCLVLCVQACIATAKRLNAALNSHRPRLLSVDPELSLLKVSQLERVHFHRPSSLHSGGKTSSSTSQSGRGLALFVSAARPARTGDVPTLAICCLMCCFLSLLRIH